MKKTNIYHIESAREKVFLIDNINFIIKNLVINAIKNKNNELEFIAEKNKNIVEHIEILKSKVDIKGFKYFTYKFDFNNQFLNISLDGLVDILEYKNTQFRESGIEMFTLIVDFEILYNESYYNYIKLEKEEEILQKFSSINSLLMSEISDFIQLEYWLKEYQKKQKEISIIEQKNKIEIIDLSNTKGTEKIIMLKQLGILDFLKEKQPFNLSTNALASALSGITGIETSTLQSYINPINNPSAIQKNNPLNSEKSVNKVTQKLISIGFNPLK